MDDKEIGPETEAIVLCGKTLRYLEKSLTCAKGGDEEMAKVYLAAATSHHAHHLSDLSERWASMKAKDFLEVVEATLQSVMLAMTLDALGVIEVEGNMRDAERMRSIMGFGGRNLHDERN